MQSIKDPMEVASKPVEEIQHTSGSDFCNYCHENIIGRG